MPRKPVYVSLARAERLVRQHAHEAGIKVEILQSRWAGRLCRAQDGTKFRVAGVRIAIHGRQRTRWVKMAQDGTTTVS